MTDYKEAQWIGCHPLQYAQGRKFGLKPESIVIHVMDGYLTGTDNFFSLSPAQRLQASIDRWVKDAKQGKNYAKPTKGSESSAHYGIGGPKGPSPLKVHQYVAEANTAWHAGVIDKPTWPGLTRRPGINPNAYTIGIEHEGFAATPWTDEMYETSAKLIADICGRWSIPIDREHICGHREIYSIKTCPGMCNLDKLVKIACAVRR